MIILLDTDTCSYLVRRVPSVEKNYRKYLAAEHEVGISSITLFEIRYGLETDSPRADVAKFLLDFTQNIKVFPFGLEAAQQAAVIRANQSKKGRPTGAYDPMLAGHAIALNAELISNNIKHYSAVPNLLLGNWIERPKPKEDSRSTRLSSFGDT